MRNCLLGRTFLSPPIDNRGAAVTTALASALFAGNACALSAPRRDHFDPFDGLKEAWP